MKLISPTLNHGRRILILLIGISHYPQGVSSTLLTLAKPNLSSHQVNSHIFKGSATCPVNAAQISFLFQRLSQPLLPPSLATADFLLRINKLILPPIIFGDVDRAHILQLTLINSNPNINTPNEDSTLPLLNDGEQTDIDPAKSTLPANYGATTYFIYRSFNSQKTKLSDSQPDAPVTPDHRIETPQPQPANVTATSAVSTGQILATTPEQAATSNPGNNQLNHNLSLTQKLGLNKPILYKPKLMPWRVTSSIAATQSITVSSKPEPNLANLKPDESMTNTPSTNNLLGCSAHVVNLTTHNPAMPFAIRLASNGTLFTTTDWMSWHQVTIPALNQLQAPITKIIPQFINDTWFLTILTQNNHTLVLKSTDASQWNLISNLDSSYQPTAVPLSYFNGNYYYSASKQDSSMNLYTSYLILSADLENWFAPQLNLPVFGDTKGVIGSVISANNLLILLTDNLSDYPGNNPELFLLKNNKWLDASADAFPNHFLDSNNGFKPTAYTYSSDALAIIGTLSANLTYFGDVITYSNKQWRYKLIGQLGAKDNLIDISYGNKSFMAIGTLQDPNSQQQPQLFILRSLDNGNSWQEFNNVPNLQNANGITYDCVHQHFILSTTSGDLYSMESDVMHWHNLNFRHKQGLDYTKISTLN